MLLITKVSPNWNNDWMNYLNEMERYPILQSLCGLAGTRNLAVCLEQATAEGGTATGGSRPTDALGKFPRRSEYTKLTPFRAWVVHVVFENNNAKICLCEECFNRAFEDIVNLKERLKRCCYRCKNYQKDKYDYNRYSGKCLKHNACKDYNNTCENFEL